jgi:uncharacterized protein (TIGR02270 family)
MIIKHIVEQHAEEAAFLWLLRDAAVRAPHYDLKDLAHLDKRVEAHLDGLRIAGVEGWEICREGLGLKEPGEVFAAAVLAFESGISERMRATVTVGLDSEDTFRGLVSAIGWCEFPNVEAWVQKLLSAQRPEFRRLGIATCAVHRVDPGEALADALKDIDPLLRARSLRALGELKRRDQLTVIRRELASDDETCRFWASWAGALLGEQRAYGPLRLFVAKNCRHAEHSLKLLVRVLEPGDAHLWLKSLLSTPGLMRYAVTGTGILGDPVYVPWLIKQMGNPELARVAGESFTMITGIDLAYDDLEGEWPEGFEAGPTENPQDESVEMDRDEDLPWPHPELITAWWEKHAGEFRTGTRHLLGKPIGEEQLQWALRHGTQRHREATALELALQHPDEPLFETRATGSKQMKILGIK